MAVIQHRRFKLRRGLRTGANPRVATGASAHVRSEISERSDRNSFDEDTIGPPARRLLVGCGGPGPTHRVGDESLMA